MTPLIAKDLVADLQADLVADLQADLITDIKIHIVVLVHRHAINVTEHNSVDSDIPIANVVDLMDIPAQNAKPSNVVNVEDSDIANEIALPEFVILAKN